VVDLGLEMGVDSEKIGRRTSCKRCTNNDGVYEGGATNAAAVDRSLLDIYGQESSITLTPFFSMIMHLQRSLSTSLRL
jgi:hypothetical protein